MLSFLFTIIFAIFIAYVSTQNTTPVTIHLQQYSWPGIPLYLLLLTFLLTGALFAWILHVLNIFSMNMLLKSRSNSLAEEKRMNLELTKRIHQLELENTKLTSEEDILEENAL